MKDYDVSDYGIFSDAISTTTSLTDKISVAKDSAIKCKSDISNESIFMGPIADSCLDSFLELDNNMTLITENFNKLCKFLFNVSAAYKNGDKEASNVLLDLDYKKFTGKVGLVAAAAEKATPSPQVISKKSTNSSADITEYSKPSNIAMSQTQLDFINSIKQGAIDSYNNYGVLPSLTLAQAILESGWGEHSIGNNIFGIKAGGGWTGKIQNVSTGEQNPDGSRYTINADFRDYDSISDSIVDHAQLLTTSRYKPVIDAANYIDASNAVRECGYATSLDYSNNLISLIEQYNLNQWDPK